MGATCSRSSPETVVTPIYDYSKLMRAQPVHRDHVGVFIGLQHSLESARGTDISIEILDPTGQHTVFHRESSKGTWEKKGGYLLLGVRRSELEASSCVNVHDDLVLVRCTLKEEQRSPSLLQNWFPSKSKKQPTIPESEVAMTTSHTLPVDSLSKVKASLLSCECVYSTRFAVGGSSWYLKLSPTLAVVRLVRATKEDDETMTRAEFSFELEGVVNVKSGNMTHMFDRASSDFEFPYQQPEEPSTSTDRLVVRCCVKVIPAVVATTVPSGAVALSLLSATAISADIAPPAEESVLTPLLSAMHG